MAEPTHGDLHRQIGALQADMENLKEDMKEVRSDVRQLVAVSEQTKGGWKVIAVVGSIGGVAGGLLTKIFPKLIG